VILLDTHAWVWWVHGDARLSEEQRKMLDARTVEGIGVSIISCWEVAKLVEYGRLKLPQDVAKWLEVALSYPGVRLLTSPLLSWSSRPACHSPSIKIRRTR